MHREIAAERVNASRPAVRARSEVETVRGAEWVVLAFFAWSAIATWIVSVPAAVATRVLLVNLAVFLSYALLIHFDYTRPRLALSVARDWMPLACVLLAYREMGWFAQSHRTHTLEKMWVRWDRILLHSGFSAALNSLGPVIPSILEIAYALVYTLAPFSLAMLYIYRKRERADTLLFITTLAVLLCYAQFPFWPSEPPRTIFAGQDLPAYSTIFRRFNLWMLAGAGIHTSVFPSAHVAGAFSAALGMRKALPEHRWAARFLWVMAFLIALAVVYGRYHYLADACAGLLMAGLAAAISSRIWPKVGLSHPPGPRAGRGSQLQ